MSFQNFLKNEGRGSVFFHKKGGVGKIGVCFKKRGGGGLSHLFSHWVTLSNGRVSSGLCFTYTPDLSVFFAFHGKNLLLLNLANRSATFTTFISQLLLKSKDKAKLCKVKFWYHWIRVFQIASKFLLTVPTHGISDRCIIIKIIN